MFGVLLSLFSMGTLTATHPPLEQRLDQLAEIATALGKTY